MSARLIAVLRRRMPIRAFVCLFVAGAAVTLPAAALLNLQMERQSLHRLEREGLGIYRGLATAMPPEASPLDFEAAAAQVMRGTPLIGIGVYHAALAPLARSGSAPDAIAQADATAAQLRTVRHRKDDTHQILFAAADEGQRPLYVLLSIDARQTNADLAQQERLMYGAALLLAAAGALAACFALWDGYLEPIEALGRLTKASRDSAIPPAILARHDALGHAARALDDARRLREVTDREQTETEDRVETLLRLRARQLFEAKERAEAASRAKSEFLANVSHELRTPLNAIIGFSGMMSGQLLGPLGAPKYEEYCRDINRSAMHLLGIINDILDTSKIENNALELSVETFELAPLFDECAAIVKERIAAKGIDFEMTFMPLLPAFRGDRRRLKQIVINLLSNAEKFTDAGGRIGIRVSRSREGGFAFVVSDTGIGMKDSEIETALKPFGQVDSRLARKYEGTGLGLPLTKALVELHQGLLEIESEPGRGTTVTVTMPASRVVATESIPVA